MRILSINQDYILDDETIQLISIKENELDTLTNLDFDYCYISGGDGTIRRSVSFFFENGKNPIYIFNSNGSFNMLEKLLKLKKQRKQLICLDSLKEANIIKKEIYKINSKEFFLFSAGNSLDVLYIYFAELLRFKALYKSAFRYLISFSLLLPAFLTLPFFLFSKRVFFFFDFKKNFALGNIFFDFKPFTIENKSRFLMMQLDGDIAIFKDEKLHFEIGGHIQIADFQNN